MVKFQPFKCGKNYTERIYFNLLQNVDVFFFLPAKYMWTFAIQNLPTEITSFMHDKSAFYSLFFTCGQSNVIVLPKHFLPEFKTILE